MKILLSNDDGVHAPGLKALYQEVKKLGEVWVAAPFEEKSTTGHSLTIHKPLRIMTTDSGFYGVSGSPADCIYLGVRQIMKEMPDWVISGINRGANLGQDVYYSGTVSAAREACILGIPSLAVSLNVDFGRTQEEKKLHYETAAKLAVQVIRKLKNHPLPKHTLLNLNVPDLPLAQIQGIRSVRQGFRYYSGGILRRVDHRGKPYYWVGGKYQGFKKDQDTDCFAVDHGYASLTPLNLDSTDYDYLNSLEEHVKIK
ncbi:MAG: 5'/3'-nucleotidase SurE [Bdellovibrionia bacterium]